MGLKEQAATNRPVARPLVIDQHLRRTYALPRDSDPVGRGDRLRRYRTIILLASITLWIAYIVFLSSTKHHNYRGLVAPSERWHIPPDMNIDDCANLVRDPATTSNFIRERSALATFNLSLSSEKLFLLSRGPSVGVVHFLQSEEIGENVEVRVATTSRYGHALNEVSVCAISLPGGQQGVGLFTRPGGKVAVHFEINVHFPSVWINPPLRIENFETDLPFFEHDFGGLADTVHFETISFKNSMVQINVESLSASYTRIETINAKIKGTFHTPSMLELFTFNAPIEANVALHHAEDASSAMVTMSAARSSPMARTNLISETGSEGHFKVSVMTTVGPVDMLITEAPVGLSLLLDAQTEFAPATVKLHKTYEGEFMLATSIKRPVLEVNDAVEDPVGKRRVRNVEIGEFESSHISGGVSWSPDGAPST